MFYSSLGGEQQLVPFDAAEQLFDAADQQQQQQQQQQDEGPCFQCWETETKT